jgi:pyruvate dehydrogenase E1 component alpha subunit
MVTKESLIAFEEKVAGFFEAGEIHAPVHLADGNEDQLIEIFKDVKDDDWVFSTHRSHYHALLHNISPEWLTTEILAGNSITLANIEHRFLSSAIMGGILPIALGAALAIKRSNNSHRVWVFAGDMAAEMGVFHETVKYAERNGLPITFIVEDNGMSIDTPTQKVWGEVPCVSKVIRYTYKKTRYPHYGSGKWVTFG